MYLSALEQFEVVPFLAFGSQTFSLPNSVTSFIFCIFFLIYLNNLKKIKIQNHLSVVNSPDLLKSVDYKSLVRYRNFLYADIYPNGKKAAFISIDVNIIGYADCEQTSAFVNKVYTGHPFYLGGVPHTIHMVVSYHVYNKKTFDNIGPLRTQVLGSHVMGPFSFGDNYVYGFFQTQFNNFHSQNMHHSYHVNRVVLVLETHGV